MLNSLQQIDSPFVDSHMFIGTVVANNDPDKLERIKVAIPNMFEGADHDLYPWVGRKDGGPVANGDGRGSFGLVPRVGDKVWVAFEDGNPLYPYYWKSPILNGLPVDLATTNYPNRYGWKDPAGNYFVVDVSEDSTTIELKHYSGTFFRVNHDGSIDLYAVNDINSFAPNWNHKGSTVNIEANVNIDGYTKITKDLKVQGTIRSDVDVLARSVSLYGHRHDGVEPGDGDTGLPIGGGGGSTPDPGDPEDPEVPSGPGTPGVEWQVSPRDPALNFDIDTQYSQYVVSVGSASNGASFPVPLTKVSGSIPPGMSIVQSSLVPGGGTVAIIYIEGIPTQSGTYESSFLVGTDTQVQAPFFLTIHVSPFSVGP